MRKVLTSLVAAAFVAAPAFADTLHLSNGVRLNGEVSQNADGTYTLSVNGRKSIYRANEIVLHEKNELTGLERRQRAREAKKEVEQTQAEEWGITAEQSAEVDRLIRAMNSSDRTVQRKAIADLVAYGQRVDILKYLLSTLPSLTPQTYPPALEAFCTLAPKGTAQLALAEAATHLAVEVRAQAMRLMGNTKQSEAAEYLARGLVDPTMEVRLAAAAALGTLGAKRATPALIASLENNPLVVQGAVGKSLAEIWGDEASVPAEPDPAAWEQFWSTHKAAVGAPLALEALKPLVDPNQEFVAG